MWNKTNALFATVLFALGIFSFTLLNIQFNKSFDKQAQMLDPVVKINENCSATLIAPDKLLTAAHCVTKPNDKIGSFTIEEFNNNKMSSLKKYFFTVVKTDIPKDLALLQLNAPYRDAKPVVLAHNRCVNEGDDVWAVGYPLGGGRTITYGLFNGFITLPWKDEGVVVTRYRESPPIFGGNSGGGLFQYCRAGYEQIGVISAIRRVGFQDVTHMNISVSLEDIKEFLNGTL